MLPAEYGGQAIRAVFHMRDLKSGRLQIRNDEFRDADLVLDQ